MQRREVVYQGHVQGVGFRFTVCNIARRLGIIGYVMNMPNGMVRLVAEGTAADLDHFLESINDALGSHIRRRVVQTLPASGEFVGFRVQ